MPSHKAHGARRALVSARFRSMEMVGLARHNLKNTWLLCKPTSNSQVKKKPRYENESRSLNQDAESVS
jgi:hypothetical protein